MRTTIESKKSDILNEVINLQKYCREHNLAGTEYKRSTLDMKNKEDLLKLRDQHIKTITKSLIERGAALDKSIPELLPLGEELEAKRSKVKEFMEANKKKFVNDTTEFLHGWLGEDLGIYVQSDWARITVPGMENPKDFSLEIDMYYREEYDYSNDTIKIEESRIEINEPTFGSWKPGEKGKYNTAKFFEVLSAIACDPWKEKGGYMDTLLKIWNTYKLGVAAWRKEYNQYYDEYRAKAREVVEDLIDNMNFHNLAC